MLHFSTASHYGPLKAAIHEAGHCLVALHADFVVDRVVVREDAAFTQVRFPFEPEQLAAAYAESPIRCMAALGKSLGVLLAGSMALGETPSGGDLGDIGLWYHAYQAGEGLGGTEGFMRVYRMSTDAMHAFFARSRTREALHRLAACIEQHQELGRHALSTAMQVTGCLDLEPVAWRTILPPVGLQRGNAPSRGLSAEAPEARAVRASVIRALKAGDFDHHPTQAELRELRSITEQLRRGEYIPELA